MDDTGNQTRPMTHEKRMLRFPDVLERTGLSKATIYRLLKANKFPAPMRLSPRSVGWPVQLIEDWLETRDRTTGYTEKSQIKDGGLQIADRRPAAPPPSVPGRLPTTTTKTNRRFYGRGASSEIDRKELAELEKKIARLVAILENGGYMQAIVDRLNQLQAQRDQLRKRLAP